MAKPGPKRKLAAIDHLDGHPGKARPFIEPYGIESQGEPYIAEHLIDDARGVIECIRQSMPPRVYSALDSQLLAAFAMAWAAHKQASIAMAEPGFSIVSKRGQISRWWSVLRQATADMVSTSDRLGLNPVSRQGLKVPGARQHKSKFADLSGAILGERIESSDISSSSESQAERVRAERSN